MNVQALAKKVEIALKKLEAKSLRNNYFVFWKGKEESPVPDKSLVVILTEYPPEAPEQAPDKAN